MVDIGCLHSIPHERRAVAAKELARVLTPQGRLISRIFKPRDAQWVARQPFKVDQFGMTEAEVLEVLRPAFAKIVWTKFDENMHFLTAWPA